ncbi:hypothetical protein RHMOL_Rhmol05G0213000 [Rhododendron molle]|uniref:Uncharacterized protein n=1 Tax=Rhododendron molle TaxID=49168 RepID=A0ACC0NRM7_RHOML|nr:hypothetical protein RHMOL_Rhmol05G0213000 [Rhododendron molle]
MVSKSVGSDRIVTAGIRACTNRKCEAGAARRHAWVGSTSEELVVLGWVPHGMSPRCLSCLRGDLSHNTW